jgi:hypothetical protein
MSAQFPEILPPPGAVLTRSQVLFSVSVVPNAVKYQFDVQIFKNGAVASSDFRKTIDVCGWIEKDAIGFGDSVVWQCTAWSDKDINIWKSDKYSFIVLSSSPNPPGMPVPYQLTDAVSLSGTDPIYYILNSRGQKIWDRSSEEKIPGMQAVYPVKPHTSGMPAAQSEKNDSLYVFHHTPYSGKWLRLPVFRGSDRTFQIFSVRQAENGHFLLLSDIVGTKRTGQSFLTGAQAVMVINTDGKLLHYWDTDQYLTKSDAQCPGNMTDALITEADVLYVCFKDIGRIVGIHLRTGETLAYVQGLAGPDVEVKPKDAGLTKAMPAPGSPVLKFTPLDSAAPAPDKQMLQQRVPRAPNTAQMRQPEAICLLSNNRLAVYGQNTDGVKPDLYGIMLMPLPNTQNFRSRNVKFYPYCDVLFSDNCSMNFRQSAGSKRPPALLALLSETTMFLQVPKAAQALQVDTTGRISGSVNLQRTFSPDAQEIMGTTQGVYPYFFAVKVQSTATARQLTLQNIGSNADTYQLVDIKGVVLSRYRVQPGARTEIALPKSGLKIVSSCNPEIYYTLP